MKTKVDGLIYIHIGAIFTWEPLFGLNRRRFNLQQWMHIALFMEGELGDKEREDSPFATIISGRYFPGAV